MAARSIKLRRTGMLISPFHKSSFPLTYTARLAPGTARMSLARAQQQLVRLTIPRHQHALHTLAALANSRITPLLTHWRLLHCDRRACIDAHPTRRVRRVERSEKSCFRINIRNSRTTIVPETHTFVVMRPMTASSRGSCANAAGDADCVKEAASAGSEEGGKAICSSLDLIL